MTNKKPDIVEFRWKNSNNEIRDGQANFNIIKNSGVTTGIHIIVRDITSIKNLEKELKSLQ